MTYGLVHIPVTANMLFAVSEYKGLCPDSISDGTEAVISRESRESHRIMGCSKNYVALIFVLFSCVLL